MLTRVGEVARANKVAEVEEEEEHREVKLAAVDDAKDDDDDDDDEDADGVDINGGGLRHVQTE